MDNVRNNFILFTPIISCTLLYNWRWLYVLPRWVILSAKGKLSCRVHCRRCSQQTSGTSLHYTKLLPVIPADWSPNVRSLNHWRLQDHSPNRTEIRMDWSPNKTNVRIIDVQTTIVWIRLKSGWDWSLNSFCLNGTEVRIPSVQQGLKCEVL
jgi:hypothetical protein